MPPKSSAVNQKALEAATAADRQFFEKHPSLTVRERNFVPGESPFPPAPPGYVVRVKVSQLKPGIRIREIFFAKVLHNGSDKRH
jgi:hypothetical protein